MALVQQTPAPWRREGDGESNSFSNLTIQHSPATRGMSVKIPNLHQVRFPNHPFFSCFEVELWFGWETENVHRWSCQVYPGLPLYSQSSAVTRPKAGTRQAQSVCENQHRFLWRVMLTEVGGGEQQLGGVRALPSLHWLQTSRAASLTRWILDRVPHMLVVFFFFAERTHPCSHLTPSPLGCTAWDEAQCFY